MCLGNCSIAVIFSGMKLRGHEGYSFQMQPRTKQQQWINSRPVPGLYQEYSECWHNESRRHFPPRGFNGALSACGVGNGLMDFHQTTDSITAATPMLTISLLPKISVTTSKGCPQSRSLTYSLTFSFWFLNNILSLLLLLTFPIIFSLSHFSAFLCAPLLEHFLKFIHASATRVCSWRVF